MENEQHQAVTRVGQVNEGELLCIQVSDGKIYSRVERKETGADRWQRK